MCDTNRWNESILCSFYLVGSESFTSLNLWIPCFCSGLLSQLIFLLFICGISAFFAPDSTSLRGFGFDLEIFLSKLSISDFSRHIFKFFWWPPLQLFCFSGNWCILILVLNLIRQRHITIFYTWLSLTWSIRRSMVVWKFLSIFPLNV